MLATRLYQCLTDNGHVQWHICGVNIQIKGIYHMIKIPLIALTTIIAAGFAVVAQSAIITEHYLATVTGSRNSATQVGDTFKISIKYDDQGTSFTEFHDGPDGVGKTKDDYVFEIVTLAKDCPTCTFFDDARIKWGLKSTHGKPRYDRNGKYNEYVQGFNRPCTWSAESDSTCYYFEETRDDFSSAGHIDSSGVGRVTLRWYFGTTGLGDNRERVEATLLRVDVPEPGSLALLALGLAGLGFSRRKANEYSMNK